MVLQTGEISPQRADGSSDDDNHERQQNNAYLPDFCCTKI